DVASSRSRAGLARLYKSTAHRRLLAERSLLRCFEALRGFVHHHPHPTLPLKGRAFACACRHTEPGKPGPARAPHAAGSLQSEACSAAFPFPRAAWTRSLALRLSRETAASVRFEAVGEDHVARDRARSRHLRVADRD